MKKTNLIIPVLLSGLFLVSCGGSSESNSNNPSSQSGDTIAPTIDGVPFEATITLGESYNALKGVSAFDDTDGDLTSQIRVEVLPYTEVNDGVFTPESSGTYEVSYSVSDASGNLANEYTTLEVKAGYKAKELVDTITFNNNDDSVSISMSDANADYYLTNSGYVFEILKTSENNTDLAFTTSVEPKEGATYTLSYVIESSEVAALSFNDEDFAVVEGENTLQLAKTYSTEDLLEEETKLDFTLNFGSMSVGATLKIKELIILESVGTSGVETLVSDFDFTNTELVRENYISNAEGSLTRGEDSVTMNVTKRGEQNGVWEAQLYIDSGVALEVGTYHYSIDCSSQSSYNTFELVYYNGSIEKGYRDSEGRDAFYGQSIASNVTKTFTGTLNIEENSNNLVLCFQLGKLNDDLETADFTVSNFTLTKEVGDLELHKTFTPKVSGISEYHSEDGNGTTYLKNNETYIYDMSSIGTVDWHNKLVIDLGAFSMLNRYSLGINLLAEKEMSFGAFVNKKGGDWNPIMVGTITATTELNELTISMANYLETGLDGTEYELLLQFGSEANSALDGNVIELTSINIYSEGYSN